jgi:hypothetical protein
VWKHEGHADRNCTGKADDALKYETGGATRQPVSLSSFVGSRAPPGPPSSGSLTSWGTAPSRCAAESPKGEPPDTWPAQHLMADSRCRHSPVEGAGPLLVSQDALRTRFIENWCKVVQTVEHSKPLLRPDSRVYPQVRGLWRDGLLIRRLEVRVLPGVPR